MGASIANRDAVVGKKILPTLVTKVLLASSYAAKRRRGEEAKRRQVVLYGLSNNVAAADPLWPHLPHTAVLTVLNSLHPPPRNYF